ncbi:unnamed protein product [Owenia fusiformis]|uniref:Uncharacterized protein n=1 Tax=Owenia fusiformis TaxID=6347 RepID=A0A8J1Y366_OWEFU|nr:unnamed protein product [Owenia fusiformis]
MKSVEAKVVVLGTQGVGKTSVVLRYVGNSFNRAVSPTIGASFFTCKVLLDSCRVKLQVWDTAGQERFRSMAPMYYRNANAALLVYDITSAASFEDVKSWVSELKKNIDTAIVMCMLANKCDLNNERQVPKEEGQEYAASIGALFLETSAISNEGIRPAFLEVAKELLKLCEKVPNSGLNLYETMSQEKSNNNIVSPRNHVKTNFVGNLHDGREPEQQERHSCC